MQFYLPYVKFYVMCVSCIWKQKEREGSQRYPLNPFLELVDQTVGRGIVSSNLATIIQFLTNNLGQHLTQFDTPLVERVDVPDSTFGESDVFVVSNQGTQSSWSDLLSQDRSSWSVTRENLVWNQASSSTFRLDLFFVLTDHQSLCLSKEV
ncbi:hypothetical protein F503 02726 [Kluyveromyces marxianus]|nr:hypothetical protein F503 02726 [Kluyveromyces marxianus]